MAYKKTKILIGTLFGLAAIGGLTYGGYTLFSSKKYYDYYINPISNDDNGYITAYNGARLKGAEALMCAGFTHTSKIVKTFNDYEDKFKNTAFLLFDDVVPQESRAAANTWNITFRSDLGSIKVGIAVAYFLNYYQTTFAADGKLTWATWGGMDFGSVTSFMGGMQNGIKWANEHLSGKIINGNTYMPIEQVFGDADFTQGFGPSDGIGTMTSIINKRPDALFPVAGPQVWTAQTEIEKLGDSKTIIIGVDSIVEDDPQNKKLKFKTPDGEIIGNGKRVQFSSLKNLARAGEIALNIINNGNKIPEQDSNDPDKYKNFSATGLTGEQSGIGTSAVGDAINGCVGISQVGQPYFDEAIKLSGLSDPSIEEKYNTEEYMKYVGIKNKESSFFHDLQQKFSLNNSTSTENLNIKDFIKKGDQFDSNKIKIILSSIESILMDSSFSQSCYIGLHNYFLSMDIHIPEPPKGSK